MNSSYIEINNLESQLTVHLSGNKTTLDVNRNIKIIFKETDQTLFSFTATPNDNCQISFEYIENDFTINLENLDPKNFSVAEGILTITFLYTKNTKIIFCNSRTYKNRLLVGANSHNLVLNRHMTDDTTVLSDLVEADGTVDYKFLTNSDSLFLLNNKYRLQIIEPNKFTKEFRADTVTLLIKPDRKSKYENLFYFWIGVIILLLFFLLFVIPSFWLLTKVVIWCLIIVTVAFALKVVVEIFK